MSSMSLKEVEEHPADFVAKVEAGERLTLVCGGKTIADVVPRNGTDAKADVTKKWASEEERLAAVEEFFAVLDSGLDLGGLRIENRDELYERD
jgi:antitoxin (DNA-binding transcriptional repressor) of toxin-antitoxin stability system